LTEVLAVIVVICVLIALALPWIQRARERGRLDQCKDNLHQIGIALMNYEDKRHAFPPISTNSDPVPDVPGDASPTSDATHPQPGTAPSPGAGFSWTVLILPELQESEPSCSLFANASRTFSLPAFSPNITTGPPGAASPHPATVQLKALHCPSFSGGLVVDPSPRTVGAAAGPIETGTVPPNYVGGIATAGGAKGIAITNYNAILGTHIDDIGPAVAPYPLKSASLPNSNNGGMLFRPKDGAPFDIGLKLADIPDGLSRTPLVAETRERRFSSWYDGTMNWVVAARHSNPRTGATPISAVSEEPPRIGAPPIRSRWQIGTDGTSATGGTALNYGPAAQNPTAVYLPTGSLSDPDISGIPPGRLWGPSSEHQGGLVNHVFADAHVESISDGIDPNVYLWIITRNGSEPLPATN